MAQAEGWTPDTYAVVLSEHIRATTIPLEAQRERLAALAGIGAKADQAAADELVRHYSVLEALMHRFARDAVEVSSARVTKAAEAVERYANLSIRAQRAAVACLSALKALRDAPSSDNASARGGRRSLEPAIDAGPDNAGAVGDAAP